MLLMLNILPYILPYILSYILPYICLIIVFGLGSGYSLSSVQFVFFLRRSPLRIKKQTVSLQTTLSSRIKEKS